MHSPFSIRGQSCPNSACIFYNNVASGKIVIHSRRYPRLRCTACQKTWVSYRTEFRYGLRSNAESILQALVLLKDGLSVRKVAIRCGVDPSTVQRWKQRSLLF